MSGGGRVAGVRAGSPAEVAGISVGDVVVSANDHVLRDIIDWRWHSSGTTVDVRLADSNGESEVRLARESGGWGIEFAEDVFDGIKRCANDCEFCFVSQLPTGLRPSVYLRDDDFRLSFLSGNYVTLVNVSDEEVGRIIEQRLSPLYVSVHAVDERVRRRLFGCRTAGRGLQVLERLLRAGIEAHVQIVLVPGVNDGGILAETLDWLEAQGGIVSVGVVPLGYTAHQTRYTSSYDAEKSSAVLCAIGQRRQARVADGMARWVHAADEFYLVAGVSLPEGDAYEGYPQFENGIGLTRAFVDEWRASMSSARRLGDSDRDVALVSGELFAPVLASLLRETGVAGVRVLPVANHFFGGGVTVTGLLTGDDIASAVRRDALGLATDTAAARIYLVPEVALNEDGLTLDDLTESDVRRRAESDVRFVPGNASAFLGDLRELLAEA